MKSIRIAIMVLLMGGPATLARAQDSATALDRAAGLVNGCVAVQTAIELEKNTTAAEFEGILRDRCAKAEQRFRAMLIRGLKNEGSLDAELRAIVEELVTQLREQSVARYADELERLHSRPVRKSFPASPLKLPDKIVLEAAAPPAIAD